MSTQDEIRARKEEYDKELSFTNGLIYLLQQSCEHPNKSSKYGSNTGNYDPSADCYWIDHVCTDCGKRWHEDVE